MQSNIVVRAYKRTCTASFVLAFHFTGAIKELKEIKDELSPNHPKQRINTPRSQNPQTAALILLFSPSANFGFARLTPQ
jgi:hypothetical protein